MTSSVAKFDVFDTVLSKEVWETKYRRKGEEQVATTFWRVAQALFPNNDDAKKVSGLMLDGKLVPAGRILSGAGSGNRVTLMNCYVMGKMEDSLDDIFKTLSDTALTMQQGGGTGTDFSPLRPYKALLKRTGSYSSGPLTFMDTWDAMCKTIMSAGHRRGAMMATIDISHPDVLEFIKAKQKEGRLKNFNVSVLVSDAFMQCLKDKADWTFIHTAVHQDWTPEEATDRIIGENKNKQNLYRWGSMPAQELWDILMKNTYEYSEPGVIFIDRINQMNNLRNVEVIRCTNPCGEQPLPPFGACDLGHINLARFIEKPYTVNYGIDWAGLHEATVRMVDLLDNVIDTTLYPLKEQEIEMKNKRRIGLGITGLADALAMCGLRYGSDLAVKLTESVMRRIAIMAYRRSRYLAEIKGKAPAFNKDTFNWSFVDSLDDHEGQLKERIQMHGLRNCVLLTVAPTGTTSAFYGNVSSGCEPTFAHRIIRKVRQPDDTFKEFIEYSYTVRAYAHAHNITLQLAYDTISRDPEKYPTVDDLTVEDHINMQAAVQKFVDASVSKTVNCPKDITFEKFKDVYLMAWNKGCKGCTTYRPSAVRGSILVSADKPQPEVPEIVKEPGVMQLPADQRVGPRSSAVASELETKSKTRPKALEGRTYKIKWPQLAAATYLTINHNDLGEIQEVFISSKNSQYTEWATALSVILSKLLKLSKDPYMVAAELMQINLSLTPAWSEGTFFGSIIAQIGAYIKEHAEEFSDMAEMANFQREQFVVNAIVESHQDLETKAIETHVVGHSAQCTYCGSFNVQMKEGCASCSDCGQSTCN